MTSNYYTAYCGFDYPYSPSCDTRLSDDSFIEHGMTSSHKTVISEFFGLTGDHVNDYKVPAHGVSWVGRAAGGNLSEDVQRLAVNKTTTFHSWDEITSYNNTSHTTSKTTTTTITMAVLSPLNRWLDQSTQNDPWNNIASVRKTNEFKESGSKEQDSTREDGSMRAQQGSKHGRDKKKARRESRQSI